MGIAESYPAPIHGVSTLAPRNRLEGQAGLQVNFRSDPVKKLTRRPPMKWVSRLLTNTTNIVNHSYIRAGKHYRLLLNTITAEVHVFVDGVFTNTIQAPINYVGNNMVMTTIEHDTYFVNTEKVIRLLPDIEDTPLAETRSIARVAHINVTSALNYGERVLVTVTTAEGTAKTIAVQVPDVTGTNYSVADKARATKAVAEAIQVALNESKEGTGFRAVVHGSTVAVWLSHYDVVTQITSFDEVVHASIEDGQGGKSIIPINSTIETIEGLPKYAVVGTRVRVRPNPTSDAGTYYLNATSVETEQTAWASDYTGEIYPMEEVVWTESRSPTEPYKLDLVTVPFIINADTNTVGHTQLRDRKTGDNESAPVPDFVDNTITNIAYFQKRLVFLSENNAIMSETDDAINFWRQSAVQLLVTDPVSVASSAAGADKLLFAISHNRDLMITTTNSQFKIDGNTAITPQTVAMPLTTQYESLDTVAPVSMGNSVILPIDYGTSSGVQEYSGEKDTQQDVAQSLTNHVIGYMEGNITIMVSNPNLEMLAIKTANSNDIYIYEQFTNRGKRLQQSWSTWKVGGDTNIIDMEFNNDRLTLIVQEGNDIVLKEIDLYSRVSTGNNEIYLDDLIRLPTDGNTAVLPDGYDPVNIVVVQGEDTNFELNLAKFLTLGQTISFEDNVGVGFVYVGRQFISRYRPTRPFLFDEDGIADTIDRIRVNKFRLDIVETNLISMSIISDFSDVKDQTFKGRLLGQFGSMLGAIPFHTGSIKFAFSQNAAQADAEFYCDNHLGCTIAGISWEGQHNRTRGKL